jgi:hypothetical protein
LLDVLYGGYGTRIQAKLLMLLNLIYKQGYSRTLNYIHQFVWTKWKKMCYLIYESNKPLLHEKKKLPFRYGEIFELTLPFYSFDNK